MVYSRIVHKGGKRPDSVKLSAALEATSFQQEKNISVSHLGPLERGSPTPGPRTATGPRPVQNRAAQQEASERSFICRSPSLPLPPEPSTPPHPPPPCPC